MAGLAVPFASCANSSHAVIAQRTGKLAVSAAFKRDSLMIIPKVETTEEGLEGAAVLAITDVEFKGTSIPKSQERVDTGQAAVNTAAKLSKIDYQPTTKSSTNGN